MKRLQDAYAQRPVRNVLQVLDEENAPKTVILGDPGAGKSTLAKYLALSLAAPRPRGSSRKGLKNRVGVIVELRQYADAQWIHRTFEEFLAHRQIQAGLSVPPAILQNLLRTGRAVVVFDGLDEVFDPKLRQATSEQIAGFAARWPSARVVVTSRLIGYKRHVLDGAGFAHYMLQDLNRDQIATFTRRWYSLSSPGDAELASQLAERLQNAVRDSRPVRELSGNPLLLTILAIVGRRQPLPKDRLGVYRQAVTVLTAQWDQQAKHLQADLPQAIKDVLDGLDRGEVLMMLARAMQDGAAGIAGNHIHGQDLEKLLCSHLQDYGLPPAPARNGARALLSQLRERNFILARYGGEVYGFVHRAFLEHLAAADIHTRYTRARAWTPQELLDDVIVPHASDPAWHEVLLLLISQLEPVDAADAIDRLISAHDVRRIRADASLLVLAIRALAEVPKIGLLKNQSVRAIRAATIFLNSLAENVLVAAYPAIESFSSYWAGREPFLAWFRTRGQFSPSVDTPHIVCRLHPDRDELRRLASISHHPYDRGVFASALAERWPADDEIRALLFDLACNDEEPHAQLRFLELLAERWPEDDEVHSLLFDTARNGDSERTLRRGAVKVLIEKWPEDDALRSLVFDTARSGDDYALRIDVLKLAAEQWSDTGEIRTLLVDIFWSHGVPTFLRRTALAALVEHWPDHEDVRALLFNVARSSDSDGFPPSIALQMLVERWPADEEVRVLLLGLVRGDGDGGVRLDALRVLVERWPDDGEARRLLLDIARSSDSARYERRGALRVLVERWPEDGEVGTLLFGLARGDRDEEVRLDALRVLVERWPEDGEVGTLLFGLARGDGDGGVRLDALRVLVERWPEDGEVRILLFGLARGDRNVEVRLDALEVLVERWPEDGEVRILLFGLARGDRDVEVRLDALRVLVERWPEDGEVRTLLFGLARGDRDVDVRLDALRVLVERWPEDGEVGTLLFGLARGDRYEEVRLEALKGLAERLLEDTDYHVLLVELARGDSGSSTGTGRQEVRRAALRILALSEPETSETHTALDLALGDQDANFRRFAEQVRRGLS
ncbi:NACHT domain-containing protein [Streptomyces sp. NPDC096040]|uniref:NACHT domain-containing protein n=1 Tax=Streptomyces sp. NPDC096040 TaxID=3155541 RepID=UPI003330DD25